MENDKDFTEQVLAHAFTDVAYAKDVISSLSPEIMPSKAHAMVFAAISEIVKTYGEAPTYPLVAAALSASLKEDKAIVAKRLLGRIQAVTTSAPKATLAHVQTFAKRQRIVTAWEAMSEAIDKGDFDAAAQIVALDKGVNVGDLGTAEILSWAETMADRHELRRVAANDESGMYFRTGLPTLDAAINGGKGIKTGQTGAVIALTNMGKSVLVWCGIGYSAICQGARVLGISTEMTCAEQADRLDIRWSGIRADKFHGFQFTPEEDAYIQRKCEEAREKYGSRYQIAGIELESATEEGIDAVCEEAAARMGGIDVIIFDSPDHIRGSGSFSSRGRDSYRLRQARNFWYFKALTQRYDAAGWATVQAGTQAATGLARAEDVSEAYDKARILGVIVSLNKRKDDTAEIDPDEWDGGEAIRPNSSGLVGFIAKNRHGPRDIEFRLDATLDLMMLTEGGECPFD